MLCWLLMVSTFLFYISKKNSLEFVSGIYFDFVSSLDCPR